MHSKFANWFKYQMTEAKTFKEAQWLRNESISRCKVQRADLLKRKEKLFRYKNVAEWGCPPEKLSEAMESFTDAELAFTYMLPNASK